MKIWKTVIAGCGQIAGGYDEQAPPAMIRTHARAYAASPRTELAAVSDIDPRRAAEFAARWGVARSYDSLSAMLAGERPEIVSLCTPDGQHADDLEVCLRHPGIRAVWCEKPLALDLEHAEALLREARERGVLIAVNYQRQWEPAHRRLGDELRAGAWGRLLGAQALYSKGVIHNGSHMVALLRGFLGEPEAWQTHGSFHEYSDADPTVDATIRFGGLPVRITGLPVPPYPIFDLTFYGERGIVSLVDSGKKIVRRKYHPTDAGNLGLPEEEATQLDRALHFVLEDLCQALDGGSRVLVDGEDALRTLRLCFRLAEGKAAA